MKQQQPAEVVLALTASLLPSSLTLSIYSLTGQFPWSSLREEDRGVSAELGVSYSSSSSSTWIARFD